MLGIPIKHKYTILTLKARYAYFGLLPSSGSSTYRCRHLNRRDRIVTDTTHHHNKRALELAIQRNIDEKVHARPNTDQNEHETDSVVGPERQRRHHLVNDDHVGQSDQEQVGHRDDAHGHGGAEFAVEALAEMHALHVGRAGGERDLMLEGIHCGMILTLDRCSP